MIDRAKVERALEIADALHKWAIVNVYITQRSAGRGIQIQLCVHPKGDLADDGLISQVLTFVPKIRRRKGSDGNVLGEALFECIENTLFHIDTCQRIEEDVELPELVATGKTITEKRVRYVCPEDVK